MEGKQKSEINFDLDNKEDMQIFLDFLNNNYSVKFLFQEIPAEDIHHIFKDFDTDRLELLIDRFNKHQMYEHSQVLQLIIVDRLDLGDFI